MVEYSEFKGNKLIVLKKDVNDKFGFSFGKNKAKLIKENMEDIIKFADGEEPTEK